MSELPSAHARCGIDNVEIRRIERLLRDTPQEQLSEVFSETELSDVGTGPARAARLAARFAAKEACLKLFPTETALARIDLQDFFVRRDNRGAPQVEVSRRAAIVMGRHRVGRIHLSMTHDRERASAVAQAETLTAPRSLIGRLLYRFVPFRRDVIMDGLHKAFAGRVPESDMVALAQAHYGHLWKLLTEFVTYAFVRPSKRAGLVRVEGLDALLAAADQGKGVLILTGHFGSFEVSTAAGIARYPEGRGRFYFVRRPLKPEWLDRYVTRRFRRAGLGVIPKGSDLDWLMETLAGGDVVVFPFDQHAGGRKAISVPFFDHPAGTFRALALIAQASGAPVVPASSWREADGTHVLRFEEPLPYIRHAKFGEEIRLNTRAYNEALECMIVRHPEQWWWVHRRWKPERLGAAARRKRRAGTK